MYRIYAKYLKVCISNERIQNKLPRLEQIQQISGSFFNSSIAPNDSRMRVYVTKIMENYSFVY